jgi:predicted AlkP superfamily phosphohydrolase/phosphomutase
MILLDGAELDFVSLAAVEGRLPSFGRILDAGASMHLATLRPTQPNPVWTSVATGKLPPKTGVRSNATYRTWFGHHSIELLPDYCFAQGLVRFGFLSEQPHGSASLRTRSLWGILGNAGVSVGITGWPLTHPAQTVRGYLVTDQFYKQDSLMAEPDDPAGVYPPDLLGPARVAAAAPDDRAMPTGAVGVWSGSSTLPRQIGQGSALAIDRLYDRVDRALSETGPRFTAVRYRLLDYAGHYYLRYADPRAFGDVSEEERKGFGRVLEASYGLIDGVIGRALDSLEPGGLLLVVSGYGMKPLPLPKRLFERLIGEPELSGTHESAPDGFLLVYGDGVARGRKQRGSIVDVLPTLLYYLGLPLGRDMDGDARTDLFTAVFTGQRPVTYIPSYDR